MTLKLPAYAINRARRVSRSSVRRISTSAGVSAATLAFLIFDIIPSRAATLVAAYEGPASAYEVYQGVWDSSAAFAGGKLSDGSHPLAVAANRAAFGPAAMPAPLPIATAAPPEVTPSPARRPNRRPPPPRTRCSRAGSATSPALRTRR